MHQGLGWGKGRSSTSSRASSGSKVSKDISRWSSSRISSSSPRSKSKKPVAFEM